MLARTTFCLLATAASFAIASPVFEEVHSRSLYEPRTLLPRTSCSTGGSTSCHNTTAQSNLCCFEAPGGLLTLVQFWDTNPVVGPSDSWTIHGLWPDHCDSTYDSNCDPAREYASPKAILQSAGRQDLIDYMNVYWQDNTGGVETFWKHEWDKHGTCYSTLKPSCIPSGSATGTDAVYFFDRVVSLFKSLPTYQSLASAGILPSSTTTRTLAELQAAIRTAFGYTVALDCDTSGVFQIYYYYNLKGSLIDGTLVPIDAPKAGSCPSTGIKYALKTGAPPSTTVTTGTSQPTGTGTPGTFPSKSTIKGLVNGSLTGGLLSYGTWSTQTLGTYTATASGSGYTIASSKGTCGVSGTTLSCGSGVSSVFTAVSSGGNLLLAYGDSTSWSAAAVPSGTTQQTVLSGSSGAVGFSLVIVGA